MLDDILSLVANAVCSLLGGILLLRFWMQAIRVRPPAQIGEFTFAITNWLVKPLRRLFPGFAGYDWASLIGAIAVAVAFGAIEVAIGGMAWWPATLIFSLLCLLEWIFYGLSGIILIGVVLSWVNPYAPIVPFISALGDPLLRPLRRIIPLIGNLDLSPMLALLLLQILLRVASRMLTSLAYQIV